jgi:predicted GNAT family acetyltransferase
MNEIRVLNNPAGLRYELWLDDELAGRLDYALHRDTISLLHTEIDEPRRNEGLGSRLVHDALDDAREHGRRVKPVCPFVAAYLREHPEDP